MPKNIESEMCSERVYDRESAYAPDHQCSRKGKFERDGKWYCGQHDPVKVAERRKKADVKWRAKMTIEDLKYSGIVACRKARAAGLDPVAILDAAIKEKEGG